VDGTLVNLGILFVIFNFASDLLFFVDCVLRKWGNNKCGDNERWYTNQSRNFGFITYANGSVVDKVIDDICIINGNYLC